MAGEINIGVLSLGNDESIERHLMSTIRTCKTTLELISLAPTDLNVYTAPKHLNAVILLHSNREGRLSLTDVPDARYNNLLPTLRNQYGRESICVVAYLVKHLKEHTYQTRFQIMESKQPTVFEMSSCVIFCGKLEDIYQRDLDQLKRFVKNQWERIREQPWQDSWFPPSKKTQPAIALSEGYDGRDGSNISGQDICNKPKTSDYRQPSLIPDQTGKTNTDENMLRQKLLQQIDSAKEMNRDSESEIDDQDEYDTHLERTRSFRQVCADVRKKKKELEATPIVAIGYTELVAKQNDAGGNQGVVLVTDASGFVASHIVTKLLENGYNVRVPLSETNSSFIDFLEKGKPNRELFDKGTSEADRLNAIVQRCTHVIHTADIFPNIADKLTDDKMTSGVTRLLKACVNDSIAKRVFVAGYLDFNNDNFRKNNYSTKDFENLDSTLKDAYWKVLVSKEASQFYRDCEKVGQKIDLTIIRYPVVMGPIYFPVDEAKVEMVRRLQVDSSARDIHFPMCDVRDVAKTFILALADKTTDGSYIDVAPRVITFEIMRDVIRKKWDTKGKVFKRRFIKGFINNSTTKALDKLYSDKQVYSHGGKCLVQDNYPLETTVIDMVRSYVVHDLIGWIP